MSDRMHIYIPTYRRVDRQKTLGKIPKTWLPHTTLICDETDYPDLVALTGRAAEISGVCPNVVVSPAKTIAKKRVWILEHAAKKRRDRILMLDDDLRFCIRRGPRREDNTFYLPDATKKEFSKELWKLDEILKEYAHASISARAANSSFKEETWRANTRCMYALGYNVPIVMKHCKLGRIEHREDMELCLQLLTQGFESRVLVSLSTDQGYTYNAKGGASLQRTVEASNADAYKLAKMFPKFVKTKQKDYKQSVPRVEVIVQWRQAYQSSQEK